MALLPEVPNSPLPIRVIGAAVDWGIVLLGGAIIVLVFFNVLTHLFGKDIAWTTEFCKLAMVRVTFQDGSAAARRGAHMSITE